MIIIVTGTPGIGKTMFSKKLSQELDIEYLSLNDIIMDRRFVVGYDEERNSYIVDEDKAREHIGVIVRNKKNLIIDSHLAVSIVPCESVDICIVLRCNPYILWNRLLKKGYKIEKVRENVQAEILDIILAEAVEECGGKVVQLDISKSFEDKINYVVEALRKEKSLKSDEVNWLEYINERGDLKKFFPD